ncbi:MAG: 3-dehydroquinate synthase [Alphaproteobacteria bacterium]|nr:3-dehydroquinate synthase [Alphaproteobacteria bacterium]
MATPPISTDVIHIDLPPVPREYDIVIGHDLLGKAGELIARKLGPRRSIIITDDKVAPLFLKRLEAVLTVAGHDVLPSIIIPAGESAKSLPIMHELSGHLFERNIDRGTLLIALGGGVIGDLTGFTASIMLRGLDFVQIPTTLLAQVDSSVGGKTGINSLYGKNTVGTFYQPRIVIADIATLDSLPAREIASGYAEIVKYGLIQDRAFFDWCDQHATQLLHGDAAARAYAVQKSCAYKAAIVAQDEREAGTRALLNLGHTFAHPLESTTGYDGSLLHGEAVAVGMVMAFDLSVRMGLCPPEDAQTVQTHFTNLGLPVTPPVMDYNISELMALMAQDKKARDGKLTLILAKGIGQAFIANDVDPATVRRLWEDVV